MSTEDKTEIGNHNSEDSIRISFPIESSLNESFTKKVAKNTKSEVMRQLMLAYIDAYDKHGSIIFADIINGNVEIIRKP